MTGARRTTRSRAALLLEVVVSFAVMTGALGLLAAQLASGIDVAIYAEEQLRAMQLADQILYRFELDLELQQEIVEAEQVEEEFGDAYPGWFWRVTIEDLERDEEELKLVTIQVLYQRDKDSPERIDGADAMRTLALVWTEQARLNLIEDGGLSEEQVELLRQTIPIPDFDPTAVNIHQLVGLDPDMMLQLLPMLTALLGQSSGVTDALGQLGEDGLPSGWDQLSSDQQAQLQQLLDLRDQLSGEGGGEEDGGQGSGGNGRSGDVSSKDDTDDDGEMTLEPGGGSGPDGQYTLEDLMRLRDQYRRSQGGR